ncbi:MAG: aldo/keto reductase [Candidatus Competibacteraceae bacterium]|jgi:predicted aldo/keto reductase-like oxidoreductase|nr:aldo/keto reductase [Candidatus Competibacteraceae bacterium]
MSNPTDRRRFLKTAAASAAVLGSGNVALAATTLAASDDKPMPHRVLGQTGVEIPILHLGTAQRLDPNYDKVMHRCFDSGVTMFDTALSYGWGSSHRAVANFISQMGDRKKLWLTSKSGNGNPDGLVKAINEALEELNTDYLDLYLMHGINQASMLEKPYLDAGEKLRKSGKTRFFGFSCHGGNVVDLMNKAAKVGGIDAILFRYNFRRYGDRELNVAIDRCHKAGIGLLAMKTMGSVPADIEKVVDFRSREFTLGQAKLKSVWADERIASVVSEMDSVRVTRENIAAAKSEVSLNAEELHQLNRLAALTANYACNGCSHLCEAAIPGQTAIADQLRYLAYYECYGKTERAQELYREMPVAAQQFSEGDLKQAAAVCPQGIDIAARVKQAQRVLA